MNRKIESISTSKPTIEGAGVHLKRAFGNNEVPLLDPFLLLDDFRSNNPADYIAGFPWHPHRGIETVTYMLEGTVEHGDSMGNKGIITAGDVQWMTAGSGIIHQEMPKGINGQLQWHPIQNSNTVSKRATGLLLMLSRAAGISDQGKVDRSQMSIS
ncbi:MAG: pirin family protein [Candidatus Methanoperedens sp.]